MEPDRFKYNNKLYIFGIICLILALTLFFFSMYILPFLIWGMHYQVPEIIIIMIANFEQNHHFSPSQSNFLVWLVFFIPSLVTGYIAYYISNRIDNQIYNLDIPEQEPEERTPVSMQANRDTRESAGLAFKIIFLMIVIVVVVFLLQLLFQI